MCGILAAVAKSAGGLAPAAEGQLASGLALLRHRGPDDSGAWLSPDRRAWLGHTRLSILDLSAAGHQPMVCRRGCHVVSFNGEIYNYLELAGQLDSEFTSRTHFGDTTVLVEAICTWGFDKAVSKLQGMFAVIAVSRAQGELHAAVDRFGEKPLYIYQDGQHVVFSSQLKPLLQTGLVGKCVSPEAMSAFLRYQYVPAPLSILRGASRLSPGSLLRMDLSRPDRLEVSTYWDAEEAARRALASEPSSLDELHDVLKRSVASQLRADVPVGTFLSGGIDSTLITALAAQASVGPVMTFTIDISGVPLGSEAPYAAEAARQLETDHLCVDLGRSDLLALVHQLPEMYDEPFGDSSALPTALVSQVAAPHVKVALTGDGGDELFGGYSRYVAGERWRRLRERAPFASTGGMRRLAAGLEAWALSGRLSPRVRRALQMLAAGDRDYDALVRHWHNPPLNIRAVDGWDPSSLLRSRGGLSARQEFMLTDTLTYLPFDILTKVDRAAMFYSLETRAPMLHPDVYRVAWSLPSNLRLDTAKRPLRDLLARYVSRDVFERPKQGFGIPLGQLLRTDLRAWGLGLIEWARDEKHASVLDVERVEAVFNLHLAGEVDRASELWDVLTLLGWARHYGVSLDA